MDTVCSRQASTSLHRREVGGGWREGETLFLLIEGRKEEGRERGEQTELTLAFSDSS